MNFHKEFTGSNDGSYQCGLFSKSCVWRGRSFSADMGWARALETTPAMNSITGKEFIESKRVMCITGMIWISTCSYVNAFFYFLVVCAMEPHVFTCVIQIHIKNIFIHKLSHGTTISWKLASTLSYNVSCVSKLS